MSDTRDNSRIKVATAGMDERTTNVFRLFFQKSCKESYLLVEESQADMHIIDMDGYHGAKILDEYLIQHPKKPLILLSLQEMVAEDEIFLQKPIKQEKLLWALGEAREKLNITTNRESSAATLEPVSAPAQKERLQQAFQIQPTQSTNEVVTRKKGALRHTHDAAMFMDEHLVKAFVGTAQDIDPANPEQIRKVQYNPEVYLQGQLKNAFITADTEGHHVLMQTPQGAIGILPKHQGVVVDFHESQLRTLSSVPLIDGTLSISTHEPAGKLDQANESLHISRDALLWNSALWASRGRVPTGTTLELPAFIRNWPNMTRLLLFPHALQIAALWGNEPHSLPHTATALGIPQRYVFGFYSAANALGLADITKRNADTVFEPAPVEVHHRRGLFGKILDSLY